MAKQDLGERVAAAAEMALNNQKNVSAIDVLMGMGLLQRWQFEQWRRGQVPYLEQTIQCNPQKLNDSLRLFRLWAESRGLKPGETEYTAQGRVGERRPLQFTATGTADDERPYRTQWVSPELSEKQQQRIVEKAGAPKEIVVFSTLRDSKCSECQEELGKGSFLTMENGAPLCLECADLGHLVYLERGDAALTRRSSKYSALRAVVVRFSRSRGRYERQGLMVEPAALERAEEECLEDEDLREVRRERDAEKRKLQDANLAVRMAQRILNCIQGVRPRKRGRSPSTPRRGVAGASEGRRPGEDWSRKH